MLKIAIIQVSTREVGRGPAVLVHNLQHSKLLRCGTVSAEGKVFIFHVLAWLCLVTNDYSN